MPGHVPAILGPATFSRAGPATPSFQLEFARTVYYMVEIATAPRLFDPANAEARTDATFYQTPLNHLLGPVTTSVFVLPSDAWESLRGASTLYYRVITSSSPNALRDVAQSTSPDDGPATPHMTLTDDILKPQPRVASARRFGTASP